MTLIQAPIKYARGQGNANLTYDAICKLLSDRENQIEWQAFTSAEWELLVSMAKTEGVAPLLYWHFKDRDWRSKLPKEVMMALNQEYYNTTAQNAVLFNELAHILEAFEVAGIPVNVLKGAALAQTLYPDPGLRPMGDLDLLVHPKFLGKSLRLLKMLDFDLWNITYHAVLVGGTQHKITVELHWSLIPSSPEVDDSSHQLSEFVNSLADYYFSTQLVYSSAHLIFQHRTSLRLLWGYDLYLLLNQKMLNGEAIEQLSNSLNWQDALFSSLFWVTKVFEIEWPSFIIKPSEAEKERIELNVSHFEKFTTRNNWSRKVFKTLPFKTKWMWLSGTLFPSSAYIKWFYKPRPEWVWPVFYIYRWVSVFTNYIFSR